MSLPPLSHTLFELGVYALALLCLRHAGKEGTHVVWALVAGIAHGILLEYLGLHAKHASEPDYNYGPFLILLFANTQDALPLCIVVSWGLIMYAAMQTTKRLGALPWYLRLFVNATLGISLDFILDPIASGPGGLGMWFWNPKLPAEWMGVPLGNFIGWYMVIATFTFFIELGWRLVPPTDRGVGTNLLVVGGAMLFSLLVSAGTQLVYGQFAAGQPWEPLVLIGLLALGVALFVRYAPAFTRTHRLDRIVLAVPLFFQCYFSVYYILLGMYHNLPGMAIVIPIALTTGLIGFYWPYSKSRGAQFQVTAVS
jgi:uncharacterized membrane protein